MLHVRGAAADFRPWAAAARDPVWSWSRLLPYFKRSERLLDQGLLKDPRYGPAHGASGPVAVTRQAHAEAEPFLHAFQELGHDIVPDINTGDSMGYTQPMFNLAGGRRSHSAFAYLAPIKARHNLYVMKRTTVTRILFDKDKVAIGIECETKNNIKQQLFVKREIILSAGALQSPQLLMLSGIGPASHLVPLNIPVIVDLPVGQNLQDHTTVLVAHQLPKAKARPSPPLTEYPATLITGFVALNKSQDQADYQSISFVIPKGSEAGVLACVFQFGFDEKICQIMGEAARDHVTLMTTHHLLHPHSLGRVLLRSANPYDMPLVYHGIFSDARDLDRSAMYLADFARVINTNYFRSVEAQQLELGDCSTQHERGTHAYWRCYSLQMSTTTWHYSGTCALGSVVDARLRVRGVKQLRVIDASIMPTITGGNTNAPTLMIAELGADFIKMDHS